MLILPTYDAPRYTESVTLDGASYRFGFEWNDRAAAWFLSVLTDAGVPIISGVRITVRFPFLSRYRIDGLPPGMLECIDTINSDTDPAYLDLLEGGRCILAYTPVADLQAALAAAAGA
jgi:hypothetical protein